MVPMGLILRQFRGLAYIPRECGEPNHLHYHLPEAIVITVCGQAFAHVVFLWTISLSIDRNSIYIYTLTLRSFSLFMCTLFLVW